MLGEKFVYVDERGIYKDYREQMKILYMNDSDREFLVQEGDQAA